MGKYGNEIKTSDYKKLNVWQKSMDFAVETYKLILRLPAEEKYALGSQMRRAVTSIPSNIAEGQSRNSGQEFIHFLSIARGSLSEIETQIILCQRLGYIALEESDTHLHEIALIGSMLRNLIQAIDSRPF